MSRDERAKARFKKHAIIVLKNIGLFIALMIGTIIFLALPEALANWILG